MSKLQITEMVLLTVGGWILITAAVNDIFLTARSCLSKTSRNNKAGLRQSAIKLNILLTGMLKNSKRRGFLQKRLHLIVPVLQIIIWKTLLIFGFSLLYLAIEWQSRSELISAGKPEDILSSLWLSLAISFRIALYEMVLDNPMIFLVANIQFVTGYLFIGFVCFYLIILKQKAKLLKPRLYKLQHELDGFYSPFALAASLRDYRSNNLLLILQDWEKWADELRKNLYLHRQFIYGGIRNERGVTWLAALGVVLDASAALIVTSQGAVEKQARDTFGAARRALVEVSGLFAISEDQKRIRKFEEMAFEDEVLSAELIFEDEDVFQNSARDEMFNVWRFTYEKYLRCLSVELEEENYANKYGTKYY